MKVNGDNFYITASPPQGHDTMLKAFLFSTITQLLVFQVHSQSSKFETHMFDNGAGFKLPYRFYQPENPGADIVCPLIIFLHGAGDWGTDNKKQLANFPYHFIDSTNSVEYPCYVLAPQCTESSPWSSFPGYPEVHTPPNPTKSTSQVLALIDTLLKSDTLRIDGNRLYVTGFSLGGEGVFDIITRAPGLFAAAVPICGIADTGKAQLMMNTPLWIFHGSNDDINSVTYSRIIVDALTKINTPPKYTEYEGRDHYIWSTAYNEPDLIPWIFSHVKNPVHIAGKKLPLQPVHLPVSVRKTRYGIQVSWKTAVHPDRVELFHIDGRCAERLRVNSENCNACTVDLADSDLSPTARCIVRVSSGMKTIFCAIR